MNKDSYIANLFDDIKDDIVFDSDVIALVSLLNSMLNSNILHSFNNWKYLIEKYDIMELMIDIDFKPLLYNYPILFLKKIGLKKFFLYMNKLSVNKRKLIYSNVFNVYNKNGFIYLFFVSLIKNEDYEKEKMCIDLILKNSVEFSQDFFDKTYFIRCIIMIHIECNIIPVSLLKELCSIPDNNKDKAVLKTLLIDYIYK